MPPEATVGRPKDLMAPGPVFNREDGNVPLFHKPLSQKLNKIITSYNLLRLNDMPKGSRPACSRNEI